MLTATIKTSQDKSEHHRTEYFTSRGRRRVRQSLQCARVVRYRTEKQVHPVTRTFRSLSICTCARAVPTQNAHRPRHSKLLDHVRTARQQQLFRSIISLMWPPMTTGHKCAVKQCDDHRYPGSVRDDHDQYQLKDNVRLNWLISYASSQWQTHVS